MNIYTEHIYLSSSAQRKGPYAIPQTAECTDSTGFPQTPAGMSQPMRPWTFKNVESGPNNGGTFSCEPSLCSLTNSTVLFSQVKLVNIRNDDIADGNPKLTLGLIWTIILHFQVSSSVSVVFHYIIALYLCLWDLSAVVFHLLKPIRVDSAQNNYSQKRLDQSLQLRQDSFFPIF